MSNTSPFDLTGKTIFITGGAGFLGKHFAEALASAGAHVVIADVNNQAASEAAVQVADTSRGAVSAIEIDVTNRKSIEAAFLKVMGKTDRIDVVVNNAAIDPKFEPDAPQNERLFEDYPEELLKQSVDVNLIGYVMVAQAAVRQMLKQGGGNIINVSSIYGVVGPDQRIYPEGTQKPVDYAITKGGVAMLTKWLATTYGAQGIRANTYTLGGVLRGHTEEFQKNYGNRVPLARMVRPEEVGAPMVFLASDASTGMTGHNLVVDGGLTAW